jgi:site-specific recombinase XerD
VSNSVPKLYDSKDRLIQLVLDSLPSPKSKSAYRSSLERFLTWFRASGLNGFTRATVMQYRAALLESGLSCATVNLHLSAVRKLAQEAADNGLLTPQLATGINRIKGVKKEGVRTGNWLTVSQAEQLLNSPDAGTLAGKRDRALLGVLMGCGLRRSEIAKLTYGHIQQREARWVIVDLVGKGNRTRSIPMPGWCKAQIDNWSAAASVSEGFVFRPVDKGDSIRGEQMTAQSIFEAVKKYAGRCDLKIAPHDLRRSFAKLAHKGKAALEQIQLSLGHASIVTTERYLGVRQDLTDAPCDHLGISVTTEDPSPVEQ